MGRTTINVIAHVPVTHTALPNVPWQVTGNHWVALPCIHPADGSIHAVGMLHRGARSAVEFAGHEDFVNGAGPALLKPVIEVDGEVRDLARGTMAWERGAAWLPTFTCTLGDIVVRGTIFAPYGRDLDVAGVVYVFALENRGKADRTIVVRLGGVLGHRQLRVRTRRTAEDASRVTRSGDNLILEGSAQPGFAALALAADGDASVHADGTSFSLSRTLEVPAGVVSHAAFYLAAGPERDGAEATAAVLGRRGWKALLAGTREALQLLEQSTGVEAIDRLINRNLVFAYFYGVGRAIDDAHFYLVRTRAPWHSEGVTIRDWHALMWTLPAVLLADPPLARELFYRVCELHGYAPGGGVHYLEGTAFEPGFALEGAAAYPIALDRYIRDTGDERLVDEPIIAETLYLVNEDLRERRDKRLPLYSTDVTPSGAKPAHPFTLHANAAVAFALDVLRRTLDEETSRDVEDPAAVRAAIKRHFTVERDTKSRLASSIDLAGERSYDDVGAESALWIPLYEAIDRNDSLYRRTVKALPARRGSLELEIARLVGPDSGSVLGWLRRAPLSDGVAAEVVDDEGRAVSNGGDAALSGLLAATAWLAVHVMGVHPS